ncbi:MAG: hypothetical protein EBV83_10385, partial [Verrucomicrobia bacterium]|nr:hypothetical protein [Verrucomicrobiota bacterium]
SPGNAFTASRIIGTNTATNLTLLLDANGLTGFSETTATIPLLIGTNGLSNLPASSLTVSTTNFPGLGTWSVSTNTTNLSLVYQPVPLNLATTNLPSGLTGNSYRAALAATGGVAPFLWSLASGTLPDGLSISDEGILDGSPTAPGQFMLSIRVTDSAGISTNRSLQINITDPLQITTATLADGTRGSSYTTSLEATGGTGGYLWTILSGSLPDGLNLATNGVITGSPTAAGPTSFVVQVNDSSLQSTTQLVSLEVLPPVDPYSAWSSGVAWDKYNSDPSADPDLDGRSNLMEYTSGSSPLLSEGPLLETSFTNTGGQSFLILKFRRSASATDATFEVVTSSNLTTWAPLARSTGGNSFTNVDSQTSVMEVDADETGVLKEVTLKDGTPVGTQPRRFLR